MEGFSEYVESLPGQLQSLNESSSVHLTVGNESCDLDSIASALAHAHYIACKRGGEGGVVSLPLLQCKREELPLRTEALWLFKELHIDSNKLVFSDDLSEDKLAHLGHLSVTLVDHNSPPAPLASAVEEVIDHHRPQGEGGAWHSTIELVGSCSTLIAEKLLSDDSYSTEPVVVTLLLGAILLDTVNLQQSEGRVTEKDTAVAARLKPLVSMPQDKLFQSLFAARFDTSGLSTLQLLQRDFKAVSVGQYRLGFSSITALLTEFLRREGASKDLQRFCSTQRLHLLLLLGISVSSGEQRRRQIALYQPRGMGAPSDFADSLASVLEADEGLQCESIASHDFEGPLLEQGNSSLSRKHILPIVTEFLASEEPPLLESFSLPEEQAGAGESVSQGGSLDSFVLVQGSLQPSPTSTSTQPPLEDSGGGMDHPNFQVLQPTPTQTQDHPLSSTPPQHPNFLAAEDLSPAAVLSVSSERPPPLEPVVTVATGAAAYREGVAVQPIPEYTFKEESQETRTWRHVCVGGEETTINMSLIQPYRKIIQHAGYYGDQRRAVVVISACYLPPRSLPNYHIVTHQLFYYVLSVVDQLVVDDYIIIYLHSGAPHHSMPSLRILHHFYRMIDRRLRKQLQHLYIVHPTFWVKTMLRLGRPLISGKFYRKVHFIRTLQALPAHVQLDNEWIPAPVLRMDAVLAPAQQQSPEERYQPSTGQREGGAVEGRPQQD